MPLTAPNGTDLSLRVATTRVVLATGAVVDENGPEALNITWLPGGEVTLGIDPASARGRLVVERLFFDGEELRDLVFEFEDGQLKSLDSAGDASRLAYVMF
jgi:leucyl aminopeptidase (aminopeptidase T)